MEIVATMGSGQGHHQAELIRIPLELPPTLAVEFPNAFGAAAAADAIFAQRAECPPALVSPGSSSNTLSTVPNAVVAARSNEAASLFAGLYVVAAGLATWQHLMFDAYAGRGAADEEDEHNQQDRVNRPASSSD